ncbi:MAG: hypothetical protein PHS97_05355 [Oscillospiraceae bacterium]|nr:hypothetical protein [Oscillospiraceae bacterium]
MEVFSAWLHLTATSQTTAIIVAGLSAVFFAVGAALQLCAAGKTRIVVPCAMAVVLLAAVFLLHSPRILFSLAGAFLGGLDECALAGSLLIELLRLVRRKK